MARTRIKPTAIDTTAGSVLSTWTTATRPANPTACRFGYNSTLGYLEWYSTVSGWLPIYSSPAYTITYAMLGGGGGSSGGTSSVNFGAGGAGGTYRNGSLSFSPGAIYTITVGAGGTLVNSGTPGAATASTISGTGAAATANPGTGPSSTSFAGGNNDDYTGSATATGQYMAGGGAGAGGNGTTGSGSGGSGGPGATVAITGTNQTLGGGGGGGSSGTGGSGGGGNGGVAGTANTGGGAGGGDATAGGKNGGSGVVFISIPTSKYTGTTTGSPTITINGSNTVLKYTSSGTYTA